MSRTFWKWQWKRKKLLEFEEENNLPITNLLFQWAANRYWTWEAPAGVTKNNIDVILPSGRRTVRGCEVITKVDIGSDHGIYLSIYLSHNLVDRWGNT